jgi:hypothetical protein
LQRQGKKDAVATGASAHVDLSKRKTTAHSHKKELLEKCTKLQNTRGKKYKRILPLRAIRQRQHLS